MAGAFDDFPLEWRGEDFTIPADRRMKAIAAVEEVITLPELMDYCQRGSAPTGRLSQAYAALLRYAGAQVSDEEVYVGMFEGGAFVENMIAALQGLASLMVPPSKMGGGEAGDVKKKTQPKSRKPKTAKSSKGSTRRSSASAG